jgi:hypothetical protein
MLSFWIKLALTSILMIAFFWRLADRTEGIWADTAGGFFVLLALTSFLGIIWTF